MKAYRTLVRLGPAEIEGLMDDNGNYYVGVSQANQLLEFDAHPNNASRTVKSLLGKELTPIKVQVDGNANVGAITLAKFQELVALLAFKGNVKAQELVTLLFGLSLHQLFCDAFNVKCDAEDRQAWLVQRVQGKVVRRSCTDAIKAYLVRNGLLDSAYSKTVYSESTDAIYLSLFGKRARDIKAERNCKVTRDALTSEELAEVEFVENLAARHITIYNVEPILAVQRALTLS